MITFLPPPLCILSPLQRVTLMTGRTPWMSSSTSSHNLSSPASPRPLHALDISSNHLPLSIVMSVARSE
jgi:hypothetical protein